MTQPTTQDEVMMAKALVEARTALANRGAGIAALLLWGNEILALDHNRCDEGDQTAHAEMVVLRQAAQRLISFVGIRRVVYSALNKDGTEDVWIARGITIEQINGLLVRGPLELVPGVLREEGIALLAAISKQA